MIKNLFIEGIKYVDEISLKYLFATGCTPED